LGGPKPIAYSPFGELTVFFFFGPTRWRRPLAVAAKSRLAGHAGIPALVEAGGPSVDMHPWAALVAVAGTPAPVVEKLQRDIPTVLGLAEVRDRASLAGFEITPSTPQALRDRLHADIAL